MNLETKEDYYKLADELYEIRDDLTHHTYLIFREEGLFIQIGSGEHALQILVHKNLKELKVLSKNLSDLVYYLDTNKDSLNGKG
tara:strand:+ start:131 stop:382 length:252 start_codon:yes stop_codon:yes gene_type:complete